MDKNKFGNYIKEKRLESGLTQKELADSLMLDVTAVSKWERGVTFPDITLIPEICRLLSVSEHELIESSNDTEIRKTVREAKAFGRLKNGVFFGFLIAYAVAVLTCFIVDIATDGKLSWFFIVLSSCFCGFTFVPSFLRFIDKFKLSVYLLTTLAGLFAVYLTTSVYTGNYWVWTAFSGTVLGYFALFFPILSSRQKAYLTESKYTLLKRKFPLVYSLGLFILTNILFLCVNAYKPFDIGNALLITAYCFLILFAVSLIELFSCGRIRKLSFESIITAAYLFGLNGFLNVILDGEYPLSHYYSVNFSDWENYSDGNVMLIVTSFFLLLGIVLLICSFKKKKSDN